MADVASPNYGLILAGQNSYNPNAFFEGVQAANQNRLADLQANHYQIENEAARKQLQDANLTRALVGQYLGTDTVNMLSAPGAPTAPVGPDQSGQDAGPAPINPAVQQQATKQQAFNQLLRLNPEIAERVQKAQAEQMALQKAREQQAAVTEIRHAQSIANSKQPLLYLKTQYNDLYQRLKQDDPNIDNASDDEVRAHAHDYIQQLAPMAFSESFSLPAGHTRYEGAVPLVTAPMDPEEAALQKRQQELRGRQLDIEEQRLKQNSGEQKLLDPDTLRMAGAAVKLDRAAMSQFASRSEKDTALRTQINQEATKQLKDAGMDPGDIMKLRANFEGQKASIKDMTKQLNAVTTFEKLARFNGERVLDLIGQLDNTGVPWIEGLTRHIKRGLGDSDAAELQTVLVPFQTEVARITNNPNLTGVLSDSARNEVATMSAGNMSAKQAKRVINRIFTEMDARKKFIGEQLGSATNAIGTMPGAAPTATGNGWSIVPVK